jgi:formamidopyrimidine-DNA glycosylase
MPELPEVETTKRGLLPMVGQVINSVHVRNASLRWPIPANIAQQLQHKTLTQLTRRAKYILATFQDNQSSGTLLLHLGMSGRLCLLDSFTPPEKHDHYDMVFNDGRVIRLRDPRRFGAVLWTTEAPNLHPLLCNLGPEPLTDVFDGEYLFNAMRSRKAAIKTTIMDAHLVVGVGNIYASESLFRARINPQKIANSLTKKQCIALVQEIKTTLQEALAAGGSSLRDFFGADGNPGYFQQTYFVYGRMGEPCRVCGHAILQIKQGQRSTFYCKHCQKG